MPETRINKTIGKKIPYSFKKSEKLVPRAIKRKLIGWTTDYNHQYRVWVPSLLIITVSPHVVFHEEYSDKGDIKTTSEVFQNPA